MSLATAIAALASLTGYMVAHPDRTMAATLAVRIASSRNLLVLPFLDQLHDVTNVSQPVR
jgi:hypothetical protein